MKSAFTTCSYKLLCILVDCNLTSVDSLSKREVKRVVGGLAGYSGKMGIKSVLAKEYRTKRDKRKAVCDEMEEMKLYLDGSRKSCCVFSPDCKW